MEKNLAGKAIKSFGIAYKGNLLLLDFLFLKKLGLFLFRSNFFYTCVYGMHEAINFICNFIVNFII